MTVPPVAHRLEGAALLLRLEARLLDPIPMATYTNSTSGTQMLASRNFTVREAGRPALTPLLALLRQAREAASLHLRDIPRPMGGMGTSSKGTMQRPDSSPRVLPMRHILRLVLTMTHDRVLRRLSLTIRILITSLLMPLLPRGNQLSLVLRVLPATDRRRTLAGSLEPSPRLRASLSRAWVAQAACGRRRPRRRT
jgi:hypothetical protein